MEFYSFFRLVTCTDQYWVHMFKTLHTVDTTATIMDQTVTHLHCFHTESIQWLQPSNVLNTFLTQTQTSNKTLLICSTFYMFTSSLQNSAVCVQTLTCIHTDSDLPNHNRTEIHLYSTKQQDVVSEIKPTESFPAAFLWLVPVEYTVVRSIESYTSYCIYTIYTFLTLSTIKKLHIHNKTVM